MDRRLGLASALLGDPHTLVLDEPAEGLSPRERSWIHGLLRAHAAEGGTVLHTTGDPKEAARAADRVVTIDGGASSRTRTSPTSPAPVCDLGSPCVPRTRPGWPPW